MLGSILGSPYFGQLPCNSDTFHGGDANGKEQQAVILKHPSCEEKGALWH